MTWHDIGLVFLFLTCIIWLNYQRFCQDMYKNRANNGSLNSKYIQQMKGLWNSCSFILQTASRKNPEHQGFKIMYYIILNFSCSGFFPNHKIKKRNSLCHSLNLYPIYLYILSLGFLSLLITTPHFEIPTIFIQDINNNSLLESLPRDLNNLLNSSRPEVTTNNRK